MYDVAQTLLLDSLLSAASRAGYEALPDHLVLFEGHPAHAQAPFLRQFVRAEIRLETVTPDQIRSPRAAGIQTLQTAYLLKEEFRDFYHTDFRWHWRRSLFARILELAANRLQGWIERARQSALKPLEAFCQLLEKHSDGILRYFLHRISTGLSESMNAKINALKVRAHGCKDFDYFVYKIYQRCGAI